MAEELLSLKWNNHQSHFMDILTFLREQEIFVDVTLACGGKLYAAHKFVLSTCSEYFKQMFIKNAAKHPIVFMKDVTSRDLEALLDFMYNGEVNVPQSSLGSLIKTAEGLQIKGLAVPDDPPVGKRDKDSIRDKRERDYKSNIDSQSSPPPPKKPRPRDRSPPFTSSHVPVSHSPPRTARSPISHSTITTIKTQPIETNIDEDSRTSVQSAISGHSEQTSQNTSLKPNVNSSNQFNSDRPPSLSSSENPPIINPSSDEPSPGPSGMQHTSKEEEMEIKQEDVVDLGDDDEGDWGSGGGEDGLGGDSSIGSDHNASNFNDMMLPHGDAGGITGSEDTAMSMGLSVTKLSSPMESSDLASTTYQYPSPHYFMLPDQQYRRYTCSFCSKKFKRKDHLKDHEKLHTGERPFICQFCGRGYVQKTNCKIHALRCKENYMSNM